MIIEKKRRKAKSGNAGGGKSLQNPKGPAAINYSKSMRANVPSIQANRDRSRIVHREFLGNIVSTEEFSCMAKSVNPGLHDLFPWLSTQALAWERYKFHRLRFVIHTRASTTDTGSVLMAPEYNASADAPSTEVVMASYEDCVEVAPWKDQVCVFQPKNMVGVTGSYFIRSMALPLNQDVKLYDVGKLMIATTDGPVSSILWGKLWVEYDVEFMIPQLPPTGPAPSLDLIGGELQATTGIEQTVPLGTNCVVKPDAQGLAFDNDLGEIIIRETDGPLYVLVTSMWSSNVADIAVNENPVTYVPEPGMIFLGQDSISTENYIVSRAVFAKSPAEGRFRITSLNRTGIYNFAEVWVGVSPFNSIDPSTLLNEKRKNPTITINSKAVQPKVAVNRPPSVFNLDRKIPPMKSGDPAASRT